MNVAASAETLTSFLLDCVSRSTSGREVFTYEMRTGREEDVQLSAVVLPPLTHTPFSEFAGPLQCPTVLFVSPSLEQPQVEEEASPEMKAILDQFSEQAQLEEGEGEGSDAPRPPGLVQLLTREVFCVGQQLSGKRRYLKQAVNLHPGQSRTIITHADLSYTAPLPLDLARALTSFYLVGSRTLSTSLPALWVPCMSDIGSGGGGSGENIVGLGCTFEQSDSQLRIYCVRKKEASEVGLAPKKSKTTAIDTRGVVFAEYEIGSSGEGSLLGQRVSLQFAWEDPEKLLCPPPTVGTEAVLQVAVKPGNLQSMLSMFGELQTLLRICEAVEEGSDYFQEEVEGEDVLGGLLHESLSRKVEAFFESVNAPLSHTLQVSVVSPSIESTVYKPRENLDFTESLWLFAKNAKSAEELQNGLGTIFKSLLLGQVHNITLRESSNSSLAELLRQLMKCTSTAERQVLASNFQLILATKKSLRFLAQIGIEKLKRDLKGFLVGTSTVTGGQVDSFFEDQDDSNVIAQCHCLCNLYHVVELVATLLSFRCLPTLALTALTKAAMEVYEQRSFGGFLTTPLFSVPLSAHSAVLRPIIDMCSTTPPKIWSLSSRTAARMYVVSDRAQTPGTETRSNFQQCCVYEATCNNVKW